MKIKINCCEKEIPENVINFLESDTIGMTHCQTFNPLLKKFYRGKNANKARIHHNFEVVRLERSDSSNNSIIINPKHRIFWADIKNKKEVTKRKIFLKMTPILEPTSYLMKKEEEKNLLPNLEGIGPDQKKIQNIHNCA